MKLFTKTKSCIFAVLLTLFLLITSDFAYAGYKVDLRELNFEIAKIKSENMGLIIWDQRPMVEDGSQPETFLGYIRAIVGIAYGYNTKSGRGFSELLLEKIKDAYQIQGVNINTIESNAYENESQILEKIKDYKYDKVLLIKLNKLYFDGVRRIEYVVDIDIELISTNGDILFSQKKIEEILLGAASKYKKTVPITLKKIIEDILNESDLISAIDNEHVQTIENESADAFDLIITKDGEEIESLVIEISAEDIKYKLSIYSDGPTQVIKKTEVFMIKYKNGDKELFK